MGVLVVGGRNTTVEDEAEAGGEEAEVKKQK